MESQQNVITAINPDLIQNSNVQVSVEEESGLKILYLKTTDASNNTVVKDNVESEQIKLDDQTLASDVDTESDRDDNSVNRDNENDNALPVSSSQNVDNVSRVVTICLPKKPKPVKDKDDLLRISEDGLFCCTECSYSTDKKVNWYKHKIKHRARKFQCEKCDYMASTSSNMKRHLLVHEGIKDYSCDKCDAKFKQKIHLQRHIKYKHEKRQVQCAYCDYVCTNIQPDLVSHIKRRHSDLCSVDKDGNIELGNGNGPLDLLMKYKCEQCNLYTVSRKDLQQHMKFHKKGSELKFFCELCSFVTESESRLRRHVLTHTKERPFKCGICDYRANESEHVKRHLKKKHNIVVSGVKTRRTFPKTAEAQAATELNVVMDSHKRKYTVADTRNSEKHFACNFCSMKFAKLINLFKHVHVQHKQSMPQENVYSCVVCDFTTSYYKRLLVHMRKMHSTTNLMNTPQKQVYVCMQCSYSSPYRLYLHAHMKKEHNMQMVADKEGVNKYMLDASKSSSMVVQTAEESSSPKPGSIIQPTAAMDQASSDPPPKDSKMVLVQLTPDGPMTPVFISTGEVEGAGTSLLNGTDTDTEYPMMETGIMDATVLGMDVCEDHDLGQVLKEVGPMCVQGVPSTSAATATLKTENPIDLMQILAHPAIQAIEKPAKEVIIMNTQTSEDYEEMDDMATSCKAEEEDEQDSDTDGNTSTDGDTDVCSEQVVHLSSGDFVEINGQIYKIEMEEGEEKEKSEDPTCL